MTKILVVDDEADLEVLVKQKFRKQIREHQYEFVFASNGVEALNQLQSHNDVDVVLSDINMPNMDGLQLLAQLKANAAWSSMPVIMITTEGSQSKVMEAVQLGAAGYVRKPFTAEQIKEKLASYFA